MTQGVLFGKSVRGSFAKFHEEHPEVYAEFVRLSRVAAGTGLRKCGAWLVWGRMRWYFAMERTETYKLNNNYVAHYARLAMEQEPDLKGFFETRELKAP